MTKTRFADVLFRALVDDPSGAGGLSAAQARHEPANFLRHAGSLSMSKIADALIDPKLVLAWLLAHLGASSVFVGLLVPIREAGALLPQLFTAPRLQVMARRKWAWVAGSIGQGVAAAGIVLAALTLTGAMAGVAICALLAVLAVARSICSVSYNDILGKTVGQGQRGAATGLASSLGAGAVVIFALVLMTGIVDRATLVVVAIALAAVLWLAAGLIFSSLWEERAAGTAGAAALGQLKLLRVDPQLRQFIWARGLLTSTALAPPYIVLLGAQAGHGRFDRLGALVLASSVASLFSSWVWGRMAYGSSRKVPMCSAVAGFCGPADGGCAGFGWRIRHGLGAAAGAVCADDCLSWRAARPVDLFGRYGPRGQPRRLYRRVKYGDRHSATRIRHFWRSGLAGGCEGNDDNLCRDVFGRDLGDERSRRDRGVGVF